MIRDWSVGLAIGSEVIKVNHNFVVSDRADASSPPTWWTAANEESLGNPKACKWKQSVHRALSVWIHAWWKRVRKKSQLAWKCAIRWRFRSATRRTFDSAGELPHSVPLCSGVVVETMRSKRCSPPFVFSLLKRRVKAYSMFASGQLVERRDERSNNIYLCVFIYNENSGELSVGTKERCGSARISLKKKRKRRRRRIGNVYFEKIFSDGMDGTFIYLSYLKVHFKRILAIRLESRGWRLDQGR